MNSLPNSRTCRRESINNLIIRLMLFCIWATSIESFAGAGPPTIKNCSNKWTLTNVTTGMSFGDFTVESGSGTITLNSGSSRTPAGALSLVSAGMVVQSHQISVNNTKSNTCGLLGITFEWRRDPGNDPMTGPGNPIPVSSPLLYVPNETGSPFSLPTVTIYPATLPMTVEITALMTATSVQTSGPYASNRYTLRLRQDKGKKEIDGSSTSTSFNPLALVAGAAMDFGTIAAGSVATAVSVNAFGSVTAPAGSGNALVTISAGSALTFTIQGDAGLAYSLNIADGILDDGGPGAPMAITITGDDRPALDGNPQTVTVTGSLLVGIDQAGGNYSSMQGSGVPIAITADYN